MAVETVKDKIKLSQIVNKKQEILTIDGDVIVNDVKPDVLKVISTTGTICTYKKEILDGKIKLEGCINTYIIYLADDDESNVRTINTSLDFAEIIELENCKEGMSLDAEISLKGFETKVLNGRKLHVKAFLDVKTKAYNTMDLDAVIDIQNDDGDIQMLNCNKKVLSLIGENTGKTTLKETIKIQDDIVEIMNVDFGISNVVTKISYNKVLIKANVNVNIMYLTEENNINEAKAIIPIMGFIDMQDVTDSSKCIPKLSLKNLVLRQSNEEENSIYIEADIDLYCRAFQEKEINIIEDIYSISKDINSQSIAINTRQDEFELTENLNVSEKITIPDVIYGKIIGVKTIPVLKNVDIKDGKIRYEAVLNTEFIVHTENDVNNIKMEIPFNFELTNDSITGKSNIETEINIVSKEIETNDDGVMLNVNMEVNVGVQNDENIHFTQNIELQETQNIDKYSMVIYFVKKGDTLWEIAKQFRARVEDIARVNGLEKENLIYPGQQLYIPKSTRSQIAI